MASNDAVLHDAPQRRLRNASGSGHRAKRCAPANRDFGQMLEQIDFVGLLTVMSVATSGIMASSSSDSSACIPDAADRLRMDIELGSFDAE